MASPRMTMMSLPARDPVPQPPGHVRGLRENGTMIGASAHLAPQIRGLHGDRQILVDLAYSEWCTLTRRQYYRLVHDCEPPSDHPA